MTDRPRKRLTDKNSLDETDKHISASGSSWKDKLANFNKSPKAVDASSKLQKLGDKNVVKNSKNSMKKGKKRTGRSRKYVRNFFKDAPKGRLAATAWFLHPKRQYKFWFNREGALLSAKLTGGSLAALVLMSGMVYGYYSRSLPDPKELNPLHQATMFYDRTGEHLLYSIYGNENRTVVEFDHISDHAKHATVAIEDRNFYNHMGVSPSGILRAIVNNIRGERTQGGSTLTQQFIKNRLLTNERSFERKIKEAILSLELERLYSKDEILGFYLNEIPYGGTAYGIEAASQSFFGKPASELNIEESAILAALPQAPTFYSPYGENTERLVGRAHYIIDLMHEQGYISADEAKEAKEADVLATINKDFTPYRNIKAPYAVLEIQRRLEQEYGAQAVATSGWRIITTIDLDVQEMAEKSIADNVGVLDSANANNAAIVASDPLTGQVLAAAGRDFNNPEFGRYNVPFTAMRQPGSSIKPFTYATLMKDNYGAGSVFYDVKTDFGGDYVPRNADGGFRGAVTMRQALAESRNIPAVKSLYMAGMDNVFDTWRNVGFKSSDLDRSRHGLSFAIGAGEVKLAENVNAYETFANGGIHRPQALWLKISNSQGQVVDEWQDDGGERVFDEQIAYSITNMLSDKSARARLWGSLERYVDVPGTPTAIKTGTTNSRRDAWLMGYSTRITTGVWVGHTQNRTLQRVTPVMVGPIYDQFMEAVHKDNPGEEFKRPSGLKNVTLDRFTGRMPDEATGSNRVSDIFPSWYKPSEASGTERFTIDTVSGKLATDCTPELARQDVVVGGIDAEIPPNDPAYHRWSPPVRAYASSIGHQSGVGARPTEKDNVHKCNDAKPEVSNLKVVCDGNSCTLEAEVKRGKFRLKQLEFKVGGQVVSGGVVPINSNGKYSVTATIPNGNHRFTAVVTDEGLYQAQSRTNFTSPGTGNGPPDDDD